MYIKHTCENCNEEANESKMFFSGIGKICTDCVSEAEDFLLGPLHDDDNEGCEADIKVDFDFDTKLLATCSECGTEIPHNEFDPSDSDIICRNCKYPNKCGDEG